MTVTTTDERLERQIAAAVREDRVGRGHARREELLKRLNWRVKKNASGSKELPKQLARDLARSPRTFGRAL